jgi:hypothetical protein
MHKQIKEIFNLLEDVLATHLTSWVQATPNFAGGINMFVGINYIQANTYS